MATGSQILSYQGNAGLGAGTAGGEGSMEMYGATGVRDPLGSFDATLRQQADHATQWNAMKYAEALKERKELYDLFATNRIDFPVDDKDRPVVQARIDKIRKMLTDNPNMNDRANQAAVRAEFAQLEAEKAAAKSRNGELIIQRNNAANETNPEMRALMEKHIAEQTETGGDLNKQVLPFKRVLGWDPDKLYVDMSVTPTTKRWVDPVRGPLRQTTQVQNILDLNKGWGSEVQVKGPTNSRPYSIDNWYNAAITNPELKNPLVVGRYNKKIEQINLEAGQASGKPEGLKPGDAGFISPIGKLVQDQQTGDVIVESLNGSAYELGRSFNAIDRWNMKVGPEEIDTDAIAAEKNRADIAHTKEQTTGLAADNANKEADRIRKNAQDDEDLAGKKATREKVEQETSGNRKFAEKTLSQVEGVFGLNADQNNFKQYAASDPATKAMMDAAVEPLGIDQSWTVRKMPLSGGQLDILTDGQEQTVGNKTTLVTVGPKQIYLLRAPDGDPSKAMVVGLYMNETTKLPYVKAFKMDEAGARITSTRRKHKQDEDYRKAVGIYEAVAEEKLKTIGRPKEEVKEEAGGKGTVGGKGGQEKKVPIDHPLRQGEYPVILDGIEFRLVGNQLINTGDISDLSELSADQVKAAIEMSKKQQAAGK